MYLEVVLDYIDVDILLVFKVSIKPDNILIAERSVDFYFTCQLLASFGPCQVGFWNHFERPCLGLVLFSLDGLETSDFVALSETTLQKI